MIAEKCATFPGPPACSEPPEETAQASALAQLQQQEPPSQQAPSVRTRRAGVVYNLRAFHHQGEEQMLDVLCRTVARLADFVAITSMARLARGVRSGAFGTVVPIQMTAAQRHCHFVVKLNRKESQYEDFVREAELLHSLHHRHVVPCPGFACVEKWQRVLIVMPALQTTLLERMYQDPLPWSTGYRVCQQIGDALVYLHERRINHRDLTTSNIMLTPAWPVHAVLVDFGRAQHTGSRNPNTQRIPGHPSRPMFGSLVNLALQEGDLRLAPEMFFGQYVAVTGDIYCWGLLLLQALRGEPFWISWTNAPDCHFGLDCQHGSTRHSAPGLTEFGHIRSCIHHAPVWFIGDSLIRQAESGAICAAQSLARRCLDPDPRQRPQTMACALQQFQALESRLRPPAEGKSADDCT